MTGFLVTLEISSEVLGEFQAHLTAELCGFQEENHRPFSIFKRPPVPPPSHKSNCLHLFPSRRLMHSGVLQRIARRLSSAASFENPNNDELGANLDPPRSYFDLNRSNGKLIHFY